MCSYKENGSERKGSQSRGEPKLSVAKPDWSGGTWLAVDPWLHY